MTVLGWLMVVLGVLFLLLGLAGGAMKLVLEAHGAGKNNLTFDPPGLKEIIIGLIQAGTWGLLTAVGLILVLGGAGVLTAAVAAAK